MWAVLLFGAACSDEEIVTETPIAPYVMPASAQVTAAAGSYVFELGMPAAGLSVTSDQPWCTAKIEGGGISATYTQNDRNATRTAVLTLRQEGGELPVATVALMQSRATISLADDISVINLGAAAREVSVDVVCDVEWTAHSKADWLVLTPGSGKLTLLPTQNPTGNVRKERITLSVGEITRSFVVEQEGAILTVEKPAVELYAPANTARVEVVSNVDWEIRCDADWLTAANTEGALTITPTVNDGESRSARITLSAGTLSQTVEVLQRSFYESMLGAWMCSGVAYDTQSGGFIPQTFKVILRENEANRSYLVDGFGTLLASTTEAPFTLDYDAAKQTVSVTTGETIGAFVFMGFSADPDQKATVRSILLERIENNGQLTVRNDISGGKILGGKISADLNTITFETGKGLAYGMWTYTTDTWSGACCSYRLLDIEFKREIGLSGQAAVQTSNRFH